MIPEGLLWNEAEIPSGDSLGAGLVSLLVIQNDLSPKLVGTGFLITADGTRATAVTAAHCFDQIRRLLEPHSRHHLSALTEFLPAPKELNLRQVKALYESDGNAFACSIEQAYWDTATDLGVFTLLAPKEAPDLFRTFFWIDDKVPLVGEDVAVIGFANMDVNWTDSDSRRGTMQRRLALRVGRVEGVYPVGYHMLKTPCIEMTIPVFSGMSGGLIARFGELGTQIQPFGFVSHAPDPQPLHDRSQSGHSMGAILKVTKAPLGEKKQMIRIPMTVSGIGRTYPETNDDSGLNR